MYYSPKWNLYNTSQLSHRQKSSQLVWEGSPSSGSWLSQRCCSVATGLKTFISSNWLDWRSKSINSVEPVKHWWSCDQDVQLPLNSTYGAKSRLIHGHTNYKIQKVVKCPYVFTEANSPTVSQTTSAHTFPPWDSEELVLTLRTQTSHPLHTDLPQTEFLCQALVTLSHTVLLFVKPNVTVFLFIWSADDLKLGSRVCRWLFSTVSWL